ncbi:MAG TPA: anti-sigma factor [Bryobacteraceae bacterium]|nr:anti-sigma factor [Bryobacteraceae bacterium]
MNCEELRDDYGAWALGIAEEPEKSEIAAHLARECPKCTAGVRSAMVTTAAMSGAVAESNPPKELRRRIVSMVEREPKRGFAWLPWAISAALAIALVSIAIPGRRNTEALLAQQQDMAKLNQALSILNDPAARDVSFGEPAARGRVFVSPGGVVLIAAHLPAIRDNQTFELWILPGTGHPQPAGTFRGKAIANSSSAVYVYQGSTANAAAVAVSVEPEGGSPQPTTTPFIVSKL